MKLTIENTDQVVEINGVPARVWEGKTESGIKVSCLITRIAVDKNDACEEFERELREQRPPRPTMDCFDARMIL